LPLFYFNLFLTILFTGLRWEVGTDWENYKALFDDLEFNSDFLLNVYHFDPGYVLLNTIVKIAFDNYTFFLLICATLAFVIASRLFVRASPFCNLALFVFISSYLPIHFFGSTRRGIAIAAAAVFLAAFEPRHLRRRWAWFVTAFLFHRTAIALLIAVPLRRLKFNRRASLMVLGAAMLVGVTGLSIQLIQSASSHLLGLSDVQIIDQLIYYGDTFNEHTPEGVNAVAAGLISFARKLILLFFFVRSLKHIQQNRSDELYVHLLKIYVAGIAIYGAFIGAPIFQVIAVYFLYVEVLLIPMCLWRLRGGQRYVFLLYVIGMNLAQYISALNVLPGVFIPYRSVVY
jgi:hypothetical protein